MEIIYGSNLDEYTELVEETVRTTNVDDDFEDASDPIGEVHQIIESLCRDIGFKCERRWGNGTDFIEIYNPDSMSSEFFSTRLRMVVVCEKADLHLKLFYDLKMLLKETIVQRLDLKRKLFNSRDDFFRVVDKIKSHLKELELNRYSACNGAFIETDLEEEQLSCRIKPETFFIEKEKNEVVYRSRNCSRIMKGGFRCNPCSKIRGPDQPQDSLKKVPLKRQGKSKNDIDYELSLEKTDANLQIKHEQSEELFVEKIDANLQIKHEQSEKQFVDEGYEHQQSQEILNSSPQNSPNSARLRMTTKKDSSKSPTYKSLIIEALLNSTEGKLTLAEIYSFIFSKYPDMKNRKNRTENAVRMNLSITKIFKNIKPEGIKLKGGYWYIDPEEYKKYHYKPFKTHKKMSPPISKPTVSLDEEPELKVIPHKNVKVETMDQLAERIHEKALANIRKSETQLDSGPQIKMPNTNSVIFHNPTDGSQYLLPQLSYGQTQQTSNFFL